MKKVLLVSSFVVGVWAILSAAEFSESFKVELSGTRTFAEQSFYDGLLGNTVKERPFSLLKTDPGAGRNLCRVKQGEILVALVGINKEKREGDFNVTCYAMDPALPQQSRKELIHAVEVFARTKMGALSIKFMRRKPRSSSSSGVYSESSE